VAAVVWSAAGAAVGAAKLRCPEGAFGLLPVPAGAGGVLGAGAPGARGAPRSLVSSSSSRCSRSPSGTIGSAAQISSAAISNSRRGVGRTRRLVDRTRPAIEQHRKQPRRRARREGARLLDLLRRRIDQIGNVDLPAAAHPGDHLQVTQESQE
jgi:hypothetical protein